MAATTGTPVSIETAVPVTVLPWKDGASSGRRSSLAKIPRATDGRRGSHGKSQMQVRSRNYEADEIRRRAWQRTRLLAVGGGGRARDKGAAASKRVAMFGKHKSGGAAAGLAGSFRLANL